MAPETKHPADAVEREQLAYHTAGHAIASDELGICYEKASIIRDAQDADPCRRAPTDYVPHGSPEQERHYTSVEAVIDYAGRAAVVAVLKHGEHERMVASQLSAGHDFGKAHSRLGDDGVRTM